MRSPSKWMIAMALGASITIANAAEPPVFQPQPQPVLQPICVPRLQAHLWPGVPICAEEEFATWYLRGDIGMTNQKVEKLENALLTDDFTTISLEFDSSMLFGLGVGMNYNNWLRFDLTGEYRGKSDFDGLDTNGSFTNEHKAKKSEWLLLLNAYLDLGTWWCVTPFVGAGVGFSHVTISNFVDINTPNNGVAFGSTESEWNFAWALHAGLAMQVSQGLTMELAYRYVDLGDGVAGDVVTYNGINNVYNPTTFKDLTSHDLKLGLRWVCCDVAPPAPPVVYQPAPQPPLYIPPVMRKG